MHVFRDRNQVANCKGKAKYTKGTFTLISKKILTTPQKKKKKKKTKRKTK